jgi:hypothetical protein
MNKILTKRPWIPAAGVLIVCFVSIVISIAYLQLKGIATREDAGCFVSSCRNPSSFLDTQTSTVVTTTYCLTVNGSVSARKGAQCHITSDGDSLRWLRIDGEPGRNRILP